MKQLYKKHQEKINYLMVGGWNTVFGYGSFLVLYYLLNSWVNYVLIALLSSVFGITNAYICYKKFVFKTKGNYLREYLRFYVVYAGAIGLNLLLLPICVEVFHIIPPIAQGMLIFISVAFSYFGHKHYSFGRTSSWEDQTIMIQDGISVKERSF